MAVWEYDNFWVEKRPDEYEETTLYIVCDFNTDEESETYSVENEDVETIDDRLDDNENPHDIFKDY